MKYNRLALLSMALLLLTFYGCKEERLTAEVPELVVPEGRVQKIKLEGEEVIRYEGTDYEARIALETAAKKSHSFSFLSDRAELEVLVARWNARKGASLYSLLPEECYQLPTEATLAPGGQSLSLNVSFREVPEGIYLLPLVLLDGGEEVAVQFVEFIKHPVVEGLDVDSYIDRTPTVASPRTMAIIEATENDLRNVGNYILYEDGKKRPFFDMTAIFAANMNWDEVSGKPYVHFNESVREILENREIYIRPLQERGIKVLLTLMPNHQGIGFSNMSLEDDAKMIRDFASEVAAVLKQYDLDGIVFDDEYADYPTSPEAVLPGRPMVQLGSFHYLLKYLREEMPIVPGERWRDRKNLITLYAIGINTGSRVEARGWGLFSNDWERIKQRENGWQDVRLSRPIRADRKAMRTWVDDPQNADKLAEIAKIEAGAIFDFIWNANYQRGDDFTQSDMATRAPDGWYKGMDAVSAKEKYGMASYEMSIEYSDGRLQHLTRFWEQSSPDNGYQGRQELPTKTADKQKAAGEKTMMFFNLSYMPELKPNGERQENFYLSDLQILLQRLGNPYPLVRFEGTNYSTRKPGFMR